ncbi:MAG: hypothetical protein PHG89_10810 [Gallionella sp.]|nr:hypothetical protein [Gallionella sp.]
MNQYGHFTYDNALSLKAAGLLATSTDGTILDLGTGLVDGYLVIDLSACEIATGDEIYTVSLEGSNVAAMTSGSVCLAKKVFGNLVVPMDAALSAANRYVIPFRNEEGGTIYRYVRLSTLIAGTIATGINFAAFIAKDD